MGPYRSLQERDGTEEVMNSPVGHLLTNPPLRKEGPKFGPAKDGHTRNMITYSPLGFIIRDIRKTCLVLVEGVQR